MSSEKEQSYAGGMLGKIDRGTVKIAVIGLGYVGLPLAVEFGKHYDTVGFDIKPERLAMLRAGRDSTLETSDDELRAAKLLRFTGDPDELAGRDIFIIAVPTPVDRHNLPDLRPLLGACRTVGSRLAPGGIVIFESTVYPGCTEERCVPVLEETGGLVYNRDFCCGYSPERINPGDKEHTLTRILKITSGSTPEAAEAVDRLYRSIIAAGTFRTSSIKVAEAAKVIENAQRDINIAFVNELARIFNLAGIDTGEVLEAAGTKWNFLPFKPGLVGGHCIGIDPYYLTCKAEELGYPAEVILAARRLNDSMSGYVAAEVVKLIIRKAGRSAGSRVLQLGVTFKENCPDIRNSKAVDVVKALSEFGCEVDILDPWADPAEVEAEYGIASRQRSDQLAGPYDAIVLAVAHRQFADFPVREFSTPVTAVYDIKAFLPRELVDGRL